MDERLAGLGSALASLMFLWAVIKQYFPNQFDTYLAKRSSKIVGFLSPYVQITIPEYGGDRMKRSEAYAAVESYLTASCSQHARKLKAEVGKGSSSLVLSMDDHEEVADDFQGAKVWWSSSMTVPRSQVMSFYPTPEERRSYKLTFHKRHRDQVIAAYLAHVLEQGKEVRVKNRQRKLYTNNASSNKGYGKVWSHVVFEHPATFDTVAMDPGKKKDIMADLDVFRNGKDYYARVGKAWKRGYLLYGPPGTGKSTMIGAIANYLDYDVFDVELTTVKTNTDLRRLLIETTGKSVVVIEDIDCSLDLTGKRKQKPKAAEEEGDEMSKKPGEEEKDDSSKVTLSGLLNFIDGLWSACGGERLFVFTTNHIEKLDPALIRRGRMDKHIEMSYCTFEAFRVLAANYMGVDAHPLFDKIQRLMEECSITPADVAENLMPNSVGEDVEPRFQSLIQALCKAKEEAAAAAAAAALKAASGEEETVVENDGQVEYAQVVAG